MSSWIGDALDRPPMPAGPAPVWQPKPRTGRLTFGAFPADVIDTLQGWGEGASTTAVVVAMVRMLDAPEHAVLRARILAAADALARERRRR